MSGRKLPPVTDAPMSAEHIDKTIRDNGPLYARIEYAKQRRQYWADNVKTADHLRTMARCIAWVEYYDAVLKDLTSRP